ncbi:MAG: hypothetical protein FIB08_09330 [Candidatus Methanoperedens sp.]|nr:hypothetical protein [Candidatus Methanoperedens sp.]
MPTLDITERIKMSRKEIVEVARIFEKTTDYPTSCLAVEFASKQNLNKNQMLVLGFAMGQHSVRYTLEQFGIDIDKIMENGLIDSIEREKKIGK